MPYQRISTHDKQRLYDAHRRGEDYVELARLLGIKRTTAWSIINRAERNDGVVALPRGGARRAKVTEELADTAVGIVERNPEYTLDQIITEIRTSQPHFPRISRTTLCRILNGRLIVLKKLEDAPRERNNAETKDRREQFARWIMEVGVNCDLIFIDEAGANLWMRRTRGRAARGERAVRVVGGRRARNLTMTFAVSHTRGLIFHDLQEGGMTGDKFNDFLQNVVNRLPANDQRSILIFDNAPPHRRAMRLQLPHNIEIRFLPAYSPFLNIVENCFSQWKSAVKRHMAEVRDEMLTQPHPQRLATLSEICEQCIEVITPANAAAYFRRLQSYLPGCMMREDILM